MKFFKYPTVALTTFLTLTSCSEANYKFKLNTIKRTTLGQKASVSFTQIEGNAIDSMHLYVGDKRLKVEDNSATINTLDLGVGKHQVTALAFYPNNVKKLQNSIEVLADKAPTLYSYKIVNEYPHDKKAYTQGLEFYNGYLYETTGRKGQSWLRKVDYKTGKVLQQKDLSDAYFGEGMTIFNNQIFWLTWQAGKGFIYNSDDFKKIGDFKYNKSIEGWGLTHSDTELIKSDGTNKIWFLNSKGEEKYQIQAYTNNEPIDKLNEIEYVNGKIYANRWITEKPIKSIIVVIDAKTGIVEGVLNLEKLREEVLKTQKLDNDEVLNGITYNPETKTFFVTGKHWGKLFEIELIKE